MKINDVKPTIESSGEMEEQFFSIHDMGMIFDILRNKMYSNPIQAICREISCNARDAHREVGKSDIPCRIILPNSLDPNFRVKDYGPGISPDRMANVFLKYTASTKRDDNLQTGGFGLGAKTPFSYSDSFTIETIFDGTKYNYVCFIDETKIGKLNLMSSEPTTESNGTEIIIPVKYQDYKIFIEAVEFVTRHWSVRPIINGAPSFQWKDITPTLKGSNWAVTATNDYYNKRNIKIIIDGIEYPLDITQLKSYANIKVLDAIYGTIYLYFGVGELNLQASREAVHLDKTTQDKISERLQELSKDLTKNVQDQINALPSLWEANCYFNHEIVKTFADVKFLGSLTWKNISLTYGDLHFKDVDIYHFSKGTYSRKLGNDPNKIGKSNRSSISFTNNTALYMNDLGIKDPTVRNVLKAFEDDPDLKSLSVIQPTEKSKKKIEDIVKEYKLDDYNVDKLSSITKQGRTYNISGVRLLVFKFDLAQATFKQISYAAMEEDENDKIICSLERDAYNSTRRLVMKNNKSLTNDIVKSILQTNPNVSVYGIDDSIPADKVKEHFSDFIPIDDFIQDKVLKNNKIDYKQIKYAMKMHYSLNEKNLKLYSKFKTLVKDPDSVYLKNLELQQSLKEMIEKYGGILKIYESVNGTLSDAEVDAYIKKNPDLSLETMSSNVKKVYPLLNYLDYYHQEKVLEPIVHYINLVDKESQNLNNTI